MGEFLISSTYGWVTRLQESKSVGTCSHSLSGFAFTSDKTRVRFLRIVKVGTKVALFPIARYNEQIMQSKARLDRNVTYVKKHIRLERELIEMMAMPVTNFFCCVSSSIEV